jgi:low temperature requirement protein LtrA
VEARRCLVSRIAARVSTLEPFFDLVFVFTVTQLTGILAHRRAAASAQVAAMLAMIWWMYDGYAWLTNTSVTDHVRHRLLLIGGIGRFLVMALAVPGAYDGDGFTFGVGYLAVVVLHASMYARRTSLSEAQAILRIVPFNLVAARLALLGGALGGDAQWFAWTLAGILLWVTLWFTTTEGFVISPSHFVERHGLVVIVALGESIVVIGAGTTGVEIDAALFFVALLSLALSASLWWLCFSVEGAVESAMHAASPVRRPQLALIGFGYWHYGLLLGVVMVAAGLKQAISDAYSPLGTWSAAELGAGTALFVACAVGFQRALGIARNHARTVASVAALATISLGTGFAASAQLAALVAILAIVIVVERTCSPMGEHVRLSRSCSQAERRTLYG